MTRYLLDTNILSDFMRNPAGAAYRRVRQIGFSNVCTSIVVASELRFEIAKTPSSIFAQKVEELLSTILVLPLEEPADRSYAELRASLEAAGTPIGANDLLIAAHTLATGCTLVTDNVREFSRVPGLTVENWLR
ncbi:MAG TPA: type II toxin-antitoxin system VapC family toxin [Rhizomicrobium sp.]|nr:type II toxin-antitoxin system VapC family toxin [Rhizomicrobium sp.]